LTLRPNTERPATIQFGTNTLLAGTAPGLWMPVLKTILAGKYRAATQPPGWDGQAARRIAAALGGAVFEK
ncbi:MAG: UDP-N-acetylglucosamine 2-epimerase (non-hydrolyzing), partial [Saprospiraceae bacterium]|nr:UDP-N-acetylglucosamine 2-epimerase (non-hydrolyzing) [Saprospiraceae bacterium]